LNAPATLSVPQKANFAYSLHEARRPFETGAGVESTNLLPHSVALKQNKLDTKYETHDTTQPEPRTQDSAAL
jgi:hypothetical protein